MIETQGTISKWAMDTFSEPSSDMRVAVRANEEMAELMTEVSKLKPDFALIAAECADVAIVLYRLADRLKLDLEVPMREAGYYLMPKETNPRLLACVANKTMAALLRQMSVDPTASVLIEDLIASVMAGLNHVSARVGRSLPDEIDKKMTINRRRKWSKDGSGHGYHLREKSA